MSARFALIAAAVEAGAGEQFKAPWKALFTSRTVWCLCGQYAALSYAWYFFITWFPTYLLKARAGQSLHWQVTGAAVRATVTYPDGHGDGPFADTIPLPADGVYLFSISPDLMADGAFGRFKLTLIIPPLPQ